LITLLALPIKEAGTNRVLSGVLRPQPPCRNSNAPGSRAIRRNPDRQEWEREWTALRNRRDIQIRNLAAEYRAKVTIADPKDKKRLRQEQRKAEAAIVAAHQPEDFGVWLHRRNERDQAVFERLEALFKQRGAREQDAQLDEIAHKPAHMQSANRFVANAQYREDRDLDLAMHVRQQMRELGVRDRDLPDRADLTAQFDDLRTQIRREATQRRYGPTKSEAQLMAQILYDRGRSPRRGIGR
jgi:hypothetical protein